jgi:hypothetical protein
MGRRPSKERLAAMRAGEKFYKPNKPCRHGHRLRRVGDSVCLFCQQEYNRTYYLTVTRPKRGRPMHCGK